MQFSMYDSVCNFLHTEKRISYQRGYSRYVVKFHTRYIVSWILQGFYSSFIQTVNTYTTNTCWFKTSVINERLNLGQFVISIKLKVNNFNGLDLGLAKFLMFWQNHILHKIFFAFSLERRWSSHTFRYGYLVTTSPQFPPLP